MRNLRALISYDGSKFFGWQRQEGFWSVQEALERAIEAVTGAAVTVYGAGRTDTGVHALGQVASFHLETDLTDDRLRHAVNAHIGEGVQIERIETCEEDFHARFSASGKRYLYRVGTSRFRPPFPEEYAHWINQPLDLEAMKAAACDLLGEHDFGAFASSGANRKSTVRTITRARIFARRRGFAIVVQGNGFLYNMVRTIAGTLIDVGRGRLDTDCIARAIEDGRRGPLGPTAPAAGLYLLRVLYPSPAFQGPDLGPRGVAGVIQPGGPLSGELPQAEASEPGQVDESS
jgi:tRNA pseudouridine38-40 synthase